MTTPEHPFYVPVKGWTNAADLRAGDILVTVNGEYKVVEKIQHELLESPIQVYNFEVEDFHTYYVGDSSILVHNACSRNNIEKMGKAKGKMSGNHDVQNKQFKDVVKKLNLNKSQARQLHAAVGGQGYGYHEIMIEAKAMFKKKKG